MLLVRVYLFLIKTERPTSHQLKQKITGSQVKPTKLNLTFATLQSSVETGYNSQSRNKSRPYTIIINLL